MNFSGGSGKEDADEASGLLGMRRAELADLGFLCDLEQQAFTSDLISSRSWRRFITLGRVFVCEAAAARCAAAVLLTRKGSAKSRLYSFAVDPAMRGKGVGYRCLRQLLIHELNSGRTVVKLEVSERNSAALALYRKAGFKEVDRREGYYQDGTSAIRMSLDLSCFS